MGRNRASIVGDEMQKVISDIIMNRLKDPRVPILTSVTDVRMSSDLSYATIYISVYGDDKVRNDAMKAISQARGFIRKEMVKRINLRVAPELIFKLDTTLEDAAKLDSVIDRALENDRKLREKLGVEETLEDSND